MDVRGRRPSGAPEEEHLRRAWIAAALAAVLAACGGASETNVLVVTVGGLRHDALMPDASGPRAPRIAALARQGVLARSCFAHAPTTAPALAALALARTPLESGVLGASDPWPEEVEPWTRTLAREGWTTVCAAGDAGLRRGQPGGFEHCFQRFDAPASGREAPAETARRALRALEGLGSASPWCLWVHFAGPEAAADPLWTESRVAERRKAWSAAVGAVDGALGALLAELERRGLADRTLVVLTGDRGLTLGEHGSLGGSGSLYDEALRVPLVFRLPLGHRSKARLAAGTTGLARQIDLGPTVLELVGLRPDGEGEARSLLGEPSGRLLLAVDRSGTAPLAALRDERWKLLWRPAEERFEMNDLARDPLELDDVFELQGHLWPDCKVHLEHAARGEDWSDPRLSREARQRRELVLGT
jgi:arylsulfatase A-like enzyme